MAIPQIRAVHVDGDEPPRWERVDADLYDLHLPLPHYSRNLRTRLRDAWRAFK